MTFKQLETFLNTTKKAHEGEASFLLACDNLLKLAEQGKANKEDYLILSLYSALDSAFSNLLNEGGIYWKDARTKKYFVAPFYQLDHTPEDEGGFISATDTIFKALEPFKIKEQYKRLIENNFIKLINGDIKSLKAESQDLQEFRDAIASGEVQPFKGWKPNQEKKDWTEEGQFKYKIKPSYASCGLEVWFYNNSKKARENSTIREIYLYNKTPYYEATPRTSEGIIEVLNGKINSNNEHLAEYTQDIKYIRSNYLKFEKASQTIEGLLGVVNHYTAREQLYKYLRLDYPGLWKPTTKED